MTHNTTYTQLYDHTDIAVKLHLLAAVVSHTCYPRALRQYVHTSTWTTNVTRVV